MAVVAITIYAPRWAYPKYYLPLANLIGALTLQRDGSYPHPWQYPSLWPRSQMQSSGYLASLDYSSQSLSKALRHIKDSYDLTESCVQWSTMSSSKDEESKTLERDSWRFQNIDTIFKPHRMIFANSYTERLIPRIKYTFRLRVVKGDIRQVKSKIIYNI